MYPTKSSMGEGVLKSALQLVDSILDCFSGYWHKVPHLSRQHTHFLMKVIENYFVGKPNSLHQGKLKGLKDDSNSMDLLRGCGFKESPTGDLIYTGNHPHHLLDVYVVVYVILACLCQTIRYIARSRIKSHITNISRPMTRRTWPPVSVKSRIASRNSIMISLAQRALQLRQTPVLVGYTQCS